MANWLRADARPGAPGHPQRLCADRRVAALQVRDPRGGRAGLSGSAGDTQSGEDGSGAHGLHSMVQFAGEGDRRRDDRDALGDGVPAHGGGEQLALVKGQRRRVRGRDRGRVGRPRGPVAARARLARAPGEAGRRGSLGGEVPPVHARGHRRRAIMVSRTGYTGDLGYELSGCRRRRRWPCGTRSWKRGGRWR